MNICMYSKKLNECYLFYLSNNKINLPNVFARPGK
jgi:hypothetical protein